MEWVENNCSTLDKLLIRKHLISLCLPFLVILLTPNHARLLASQSSLLPLLNIEARKCFFLKQIASCDKALIMTDDLQRKAAGSEKDYSCQTYALGFGSDLLMAKLEQSRLEEALKMLDSVNKLCSAF